MSVANFEQIGPADKPSPSIWKSCRKQLLNDLGLGVYHHAEFLAVEDVSGAEGLTFDGMKLDGDTPVVTSGILPVGIANGRIDIETDGDDNDAFALFAQTMAEFGIDSGNRVWIEARLHFGEAAADQAMFFGYAEEDGLNVDIVVDNGLTVGGQSMAGFSLLTGDTGAINCVYGLDADTTVTVLADASRSAVITAGGGTVADFPVADEYHKLGMSFNGKDRLSYFFDGHNVANATIASATFANDVQMGPIFVLKNGDGNARSANLDWFRFAYQNRY